ELALDVNGAANWEKLWGKPVERVQFQPRVWPSKRLGSPAFAGAPLFRASTIPGIVLTASDGQDIGCRLNRLTLPSRGQLNRSLALSNRPVRGEPFEPAQILRVDATKRDLGRFLADTNYKDRTVVVVTGHGMRKSSPIHVRGKRLRLRFETTGDTPLVLMPRDLATRSLKSADDYRAFIEVVEGGIEIVGGMFRIGSSASKADPQWFLSVEDGDFSIRQTYITGPMLQSNRYQGLIDWRGTREAPAGREYAAYGEIVGSSLLTKGTLLRSPLQGRALHVHNSLLVSLDDLTTLTFPAQELSIHSTLDIAQSTLSSGGVCFDLIGTRENSSSSPLRLFVDQTVFSVPVKSKVRPAPRPAIVRCTKDLDRPGNVVWWGTSNAFALDVVKYLDDGREPVAGERQAFRNVWSEAWGDGHVSDALAGRGDVLLTKALPVPSRVRPEQFALEAGTPAATAGTGGEPLGARVKELPDPAVKLENKTNNDTGGTKKKAKSGRAVLE
ncbi:MAG: hypothetical protein CMJ48_11960, partial [Planctomycetaceae bacterium]|nr:hypothetical protein [Planctomycetaceae bacterium]